MTTYPNLAALLERLESKLEAPAKEYLDVFEAAEFTRLSKAQLDSWRSLGNGGPAFIRVGKRCLYRAEDLRSFINAHIVRVACPHRVVQGHS
jgi:hypothetical protein